MRLALSLLLLGTACTCLASIGAEEQDVAPMSWGSALFEEITKLQPRPPPVVLSNPDNTHHADVRRVLTLDCPPPPVVPMRGSSRPIIPTAVSFESLPSLVSDTVPVSSLPPIVSPSASVSSPPEMEAEEDRAPVVDLPTYHQMVEFNTALRAMGFGIINVLGDGNCFWRALSVGLGEPEGAHMDLRTRVVAYMRQNYDRFRVVFQGADEYAGTSWEAFLQEQGTNTRYPHSITINAAALLMNIDLVLHEPRRMGELGTTDYHLNPGTGRREVHIVYNGYNHYGYAYEVTPAQPISAADDMWEVVEDYVPLRNAEVADVEPGQDSPLSSNPMPANDNALVHDAVSVADPIYQIPIGTGRPRRAAALAASSTWRNADDESEYDQAEYVSEIIGSKRKARSKVKPAHVPSKVKTADAPSTAIVVAKPAKKPKIQTKRRCAAENCTNGVQAFAYCIKHGERCIVEDCNNGAAGSSGKCAKHNGWNLCTVDGCYKQGIGPTRKCKAHGGGYRCIADGCSKPRLRGSKFCKQHVGEDAWYGARAKIIFFFPFFLCSRHIFVGVKFSSI